MLVNCYTDRALLITEDKDREKKRNIKYLEILIFKICI